MRRPSWSCVTPTAGEPIVLVDTSVAVPLLVGDHAAHDVVFDALGDRRLGLAGHAAFETFSVLTRLPPPARRGPAVVDRILQASFADSRFLSDRAGAHLFAGLARVGISGGAVYDALVGATAVEHDLVLATRDERALGVYRALEVRVEVVR